MVSLKRIASFLTLLLSVPTVALAVMHGSLPPADSPGGQPLHLSAGAVKAAAKPIDDPAASPGMGRSNSTQDQTQPGMCRSANLSRVLRGLCVAYCEAQDCDSSSSRASSQACEQTRAEFRRRSGGEDPPCVPKDSDGDGVVDSLDNCPATYNQDQADGDADGVGNACDNCPVVANQDQADRDEDKIGDACDSVDNPIISDLSVTKQRMTYQCYPVENLCCIDPPLCSCCCLTFVWSVSEQIDLVTINARIRTVPGAPGLQSASVRVHDPTHFFLESLDMLDMGIESFVGYEQVGINDYVLVYSGDTTEGDGIYTRKFFVHTPATQNEHSCVALTDRNTWGYTFTTHHSSPFPTDPLQFGFEIQAVDQAGNSSTAPILPLAIQSIFLDVQDLPAQCGPPTGQGGCAPN